MLWTIRPGAFYTTFLLDGNLYVHSTRHFSVPYYLEPALKGKLPDGFFFQEVTANRLGHDIVIRSYHSPSANELAAVSLILYHVLDVCFQKFKENLDEHLYPHPGP